MKFKIDSHSFLSRGNKSLQPKRIDEGEIDLYTNIILDKRNTQNVKCFKTTISIHKTINERYIQLVDTKTPKTTKRTRIDLENLENPQYLEYFKNYEFIKLNVY